jgi:hypothetical protein
MDQTSPTSSGQPEISFRPITEGLGFHPFSDGLPYAPIAKNPRPSPPPISPAMVNSMGAGAVAAGPSKMVFPNRPVVPNIVVPVAQKESVDKRIQKRKPITLGRYYLTRRMLAYFFDTGLNIALCGAGFCALVWNEGINTDFFTSPSIMIMVGLFLGLFNWLLITFQDVVFSTSIGKHVFGLRLRPHGPLLLLRALFFIPSVGLFGLGLLWSLVDSKKRCWHDRIVGIQPFE